MTASLPRSGRAPQNPFKGLHKVKRPGGGHYYYAWRGGPPVAGKYGSPEFVASFAEAHAEHKAPDKSRFGGIVSAYKASDQYKALAVSTRKLWGIWLDRIAFKFGDTKIAAFDRPKQIKPIIKEWRDNWGKTPRTADYGMQVLSRVMSFAVEDGLIARNPCEGIKGLYSSNRSEIIWTDADMKQVKAVSAREVGWAVDLAAHTGLRLSDLIRLSWSHVGENEIVMPTGKSGGTKEAVIPLYADLRAVLAHIPKKSPIVLTSARWKRPWTKDGLGSSFNKAKIAAEMQDRNLHFHDLRGTAATKFYLAGLTIREIAEIMAWEEEQVERIIRRYVGRQAATKALIEKLDRARGRTKTVKTGVKPA